MLKRIATVFVLLVALSLVFATAAYANFGPHGGYEDDTDSCAGCHRAHTSFSTVGWTDQLGTQHESALLVGGATSMTEFCNACHGSLAPGASTNVVDGVFDSGPSGADGILEGAASGTTGTDGGSVVVAYETSSTFNAPLNGGGFTQMPDPYVWESSATVSYKAISSAHSMEVAGPLWGANNAVPRWPNLTCTDCHDPHGTSNYRLLKADVNGATVGGYAADGETPQAFVYSYETGYPDPTTGTEGWLKHEAGALQMEDYRPDYTGGTKILHQDATGAESLSQWCAACHENYAEREGNTAANGGINALYNYDVAGVWTGAQDFEDGVVGPEKRHRHPVDITLAAGYGAGRALQEQVVSDQAWVPLEQDLGPGTEFYQNYLGCLTCHRAHGSSVDMTGWAAASLTTNTAGTVIPVRDGIPGVSPDKLGVAGLSGDTTPTGSSALLRADNRGVCERCHNK